MAAAGFNRDATQLRTKWKHLKQDYKVELVRIEKNGAASSRMSYFHLLHEVLSCKPSNAMTYLCEVVSSEYWTKWKVEFRPYFIVLTIVSINFVLTTNLVLSLLDSPPRLDIVDTMVSTSIKTEYIEENMKMETDYYRVNEPQVDIIQTCDVQTQTEGTLEQRILQKLNALENSINVLRDDVRRDRETQNVLMENHIRILLENQKTLIENFFKHTKTEFPSKTVAMTEL